MALHHHFSETATLSPDAKIAPLDDLSDVLLPVTVPGYSPMANSLRVHFAIKDRPLRSRYLDFLMEIPSLQVISGQAGATARVDICVYAQVRRADVCHRPGPGLDVRPLCIGRDDTDASLLRALSRGAWGFLTPEATCRDVGQVIARLARGECQIVEFAAARPDVAGALLNAFQVHHAGNGSSPLLERSPLSQRETEILMGVARGDNTRTIAARLRLAEQTVKNRITGILNKTGARHRAQAAAMAARRGWLPDLQ